MEEDDEVKKKIERGKELERKEKEMQDFIIRTLGTEDKEVQEYIQLIKRLNYMLDHLVDDDFPGVPQDFLMNYLLLGKKLHDKAMMKYQKDVN